MQFYKFRFIEYQEIFVGKLYPLIDLGWLPSREAISHLTAQALPTLEQIKYYKLDFLSRVTFVFSGNIHNPPLVTY